MQAESKAKLKFKRNLYRLAMTGFVVVVIWIGFEIYFSYTSKPKQEVKSINLQPLTPNIHLELAKKLQQRDRIDPATLESFKTSLPRVFPATSDAPTPEPFIPPATESTESALLPISQ